MTQLLHPEARRPTSAPRLVDPPTFENLIVRPVGPIASPPGRLVDWLLR